jgi:hypothetical protein
LGGYTPIYPPVKNNYETGQMEIDQEKMNYYKTFLDHAKKFMMDFKVAGSTNDEKNNQQPPVPIKKKPDPPP